MLNGGTVEKLMTDYFMCYESECERALVFLFFFFFYFFSFKFGSFGRKWNNGILRIVED